MHVDRDRFLEEGYLILRNVIPPDELHELRASYEIMVERQRAIWARERNADDPPGGAWDTSAQPWLNLYTLADQIDGQTAKTVEIWLHENTQGVSSHLLEVEDAAVTEMTLMCNPARDYGTTNHRGWHRDFYPPYCAPLQAYAEDIIENGPRYVQWNIPLYDDDVLWVVPGSHKRFNTEQENQLLRKDPCVPLPGGVQTHLKAGDGVVYILPILHWGSNYSTKMRRTIHGGFSTFTYYPNLSYREHLSASAQVIFERWAQRSKQMLGHTESVLRVAIEKDGAVYHAGLEELHPGRGEKGNLQSTIFLSKTAKRINNLKRPDFDILAEQERTWATSMHPMTLQWGVLLADRFSPEEAKILWERFKPVDDSLQAEEDQWAPGFQGDSTRYYFNQVPADFSVESFISDWGM